MGASGAFVVSLDFELHWGVRDKWSLAEYRRNLLGVWDAVPALLALFRASEIHVTWATVGLLFCDDKRELLAALPERRPAYARPGLSPYDALAEVGDSERDDPFHFAPSLIRQIAATPHQEIGSHSFSHYYCLEAGQEPADFRADLEAAIRLTRTKLGLTPRSIVFPRNQVHAAYLAVCRDLGFSAYRGNLDTWLYRARADEDESHVRRAVRLVDAYVPLTGRNARPLTSAEAGPRNVLASRYLRPYAPGLRHLEPLRLRRIERDLRAAAVRGHVFHLWWHPHDFGIHLRENLAVLRHILACFGRLREGYGMESLPLAEAGAASR